MRCAVPNCDTPAVPRNVPYEPIGVGDSHGFRAIELCGSHWTMGAKFLGDPLRTIVNLAGPGELLGGLRAEDPVYEQRLRAEDPVYERVYAAALAMWNATGDPRRVREVVLDVLRQAGLR